MRIIAHRGAWNVPQDLQQPNSLEAFDQALAHHWGIEVDIRDYKGELRISHNPADSNSLPLSVLLDSYRARKSTGCIAFNIKADGLQTLLQQQLDRYHIKHYFTFDMSIPNTLEDARFNLKFFLRQSEYDFAFAQLYQICDGIWIDQFTQNSAILGWNLSSIKRHKQIGKKICYVSPELHPWGRLNNLHLEVWARLRQITKDLDDASIYICTDYPKQAEEYFNAKN